MLRILLWFGYETFNFKLASKMHYALYLNIVNMVDIYFIFYACMQCGHVMQSTFNSLKMIIIINKKLNFILK